MTSGQFAVLRAMSTITHSTDLDEFLSLVGLTMTDVLDVLRNLSKDGFVTKTEKGYTIAEKGKLALIVFDLLPEDKAFNFYVRIDQPVGVSARSVKEFYEIVKTVVSDSLEFHLGREDFENWVKTTINDSGFALELAGLRQAGLKGEALRKQILLAMVERFDEDVLNREWLA